MSGRWSFAQSTGLIIGKFMPPHAGHLHLFSVARPQVDELVVVLFSKAAEPIPGALRLAWLRELLPGASIVHVEREGQVDFEDPGAWSFWVGVIQEALPCRPDVVFSSEPYGDELARRLGARHVLVDAARRAVPVSASQIRARPMAHWSFIPPPVRSYYARRVAIVGAESTGKTTLAQALAAHFHTAWAPEFAREYLQGRPGPLTPEDMLVIAREQAALEERQARQADRLLVCDTNLLTTQLWYERYFGDCPPEIRRLSAERAADLYLLCGTDAPWSADGLRDSPDRREWFQQRFRSELEARGLPLVALGGPHAERLAAAIRVVAPLLADSAPARSAGSARLRLEAGDA